MNISAHGPISISILLVLILLAGCGPEFDTLEITPIEPPPVSVSISGEGPIIMPAEMALAVSVRPISGNDKDYDGYDGVDLSSKDEAIFAVAPTNAGRVFILMGIAVGTTCMEVRINGKKEACIDVQVTP
ncbi:MAG: hypothetical protein QNJ97_02835 [Myxococcota bacterium]|nr:hypothetical protein [Myxococcota bacterium]